MVGCQGESNSLVCKAYQNCSRNFVSETCEEHLLFRSMVFDEPHHHYNCYPHIHPCHFVVSEKNLLPPPPPLHFMTGGDSKRILISNRRGITAMYIFVIFHNFCVKRHMFCCITFCIIYFVFMFNTLL